MKPESKLILFSVICFGVFLRVYQLDFQCLWTEELYTQSMVQLPAVDIIIKSITSDFTPPLYYLAAHFLEPRIVSVICGVLTIVVMYFVGTEYKDDITGLYCAGATAFLFPFIYYSQFGRSYSMSILVFAITLLFYNREKLGYLFVIFASLSIWVHLFNVIPVAFMLLYSEHMNKKLMVGIPVLTSPLIIPLYNAVVNRTSAIANFGMTLSDILYVTPIELFGSLYVPATILVLYSCLNKIYTRLILIAISTISLGIVVSLYIPFFPRYFLVVDMIFILIISRVLSDFTRNQYRWLQYLIVILVMIFIASFQHQDFVLHYFTQQYSCNGEISLL
jgi:mannosyltransferase